MRICDRPTLCLQHKLGGDVLRGVFELSLATVVVDLDDIEIADGLGEVPHARGVGLAQDAGRYAVASRFDPVRDPADAVVDLGSHVCEVDPEPCLTGPLSLLERDLLAECDFDREAAPSPDVPSMNSPYSLIARRRTSEGILRAEPLFSSRRRSSTLKASWPLWATGKNVDLPLPCGPATKSMTGATTESAGFTRRRRLPPNISAGSSR